MSWSTTEALLSSYASSWLLARDQFEAFHLVTDGFGKELLVDQLGIGYDQVHLIEESELIPSLWAMGKLAAYGTMTEPFCHIDSDVFLFDPLPAWLLKARIGAQEAEVLDITKPTTHYSLGEYSKTMYLPEAWKWCLAHGDIQLAVNMGIYVCNDLAINRKYLAATREFIEQNVDEIMELKRPERMCVTFEQYGLASTCTRLGVQIDTLFSKPSSIPEWGKGYCHLIGPTKRKPDFGQKVIDLACYERPKMEAALSNAAGVFELARKHLN